MSDLSKFFQPRSIAFVGATSDEKKLGGRRFRSLVDGGFKGKIYAVRPSAKVVRGIPAYRTLLEIPSPVDLAVIVVPSDTVQSTIHDCATLGIPAIMLISAGFGEVDFVPIGEALREVSYDGVVSVEVFKFEEGPEIIATLSLANLKEAFGC